MLQLLGLSLLCFGGGIQSAVALQKWFRGGRFWIDVLKAASLLVFAFAIFCKLSQVIS
jgi:hypothetical protein